MKYKLVELDEILPAIISGHPLAFDTETDGKYGKICLAQFYQNGWDEVLMVQNPNPYVLYAILTKIQTPLIMQNVSYDVSTIQRQTGSRYIPNFFEDTLLLARIHWPQLDSYSLDDLLAKTLGYDPYKQLGINKKAMQKAK